MFSLSTKYMYILLTHSTRQHWRLFFFRFSIFFHTKWCRVATSTQFFFKVSDVGGCNFEEETRPAKVAPNMLSGTLQKATYIYQHYYHNCWKQHAEHRKEEPSTRRVFELQYHLQVISPKKGYVPPDYCFQYYRTACTGRHKPSLHYLDVSGSHLGLESVAVTLSHDKKKT